MKEIRFHGSGGHGIVVAAKLLADAAAKAGYHAQSFASYGALRRGGMVESYVRIDNQRISPHCKIYEADLTVLMDDQFVQNREILSGIKPGSQVLINSQAPAKAFPMPGQVSVTTVDAVGIARNNELILSSGLPIMNTVILGAALAMLADIGMEHLAVAMQDAGIPAADKNIRAARQAYESVEMQKAAASLPEPSTPQLPRVSEERHPVYCERRSPCEVHCPASEPIRSYIAHIQQGQVKEALEEIRQENPFPGLCGRVCFHPCESQCNRREFDQAVSINALERAAFDLASRGPVRGPAQRERTGKKVGIIGAGPAGLSCAYFLTLLGHHATVFESQPVAGGIPRVGIPSYRLPRDIIDSEINRMIAIGVKVKRNREVGKDISFERVMKQNDACLIAAGAHACVKLAIPGEDMRGVVSGLDFLRDVAFDRAKSIKKRDVVVIGGGNTAVDAARTALRLGAKEVTIVYRRSVEEMPAYAEEREAAEREGVTILPFAAPIHIHGDGKKVTGVECLKTRPVQGAQGGRPVPEPVHGTNFTVDAASLIVATGEAPALQFLPASIEMDGPVIKTDNFGRTSLAGVFAGGDAASLSRSVADAIGSGKRAAIGIDLFLNSKDDRSLINPAVATSGGFSMRRYLAGEQHIEDAPVALFGDLNPAYFIEEPRRKRPELPVSERVRTFVEVRSGLSNNEAIQEAARCFQCGRCTSCENCYIFCSDIAISLDLAPHAPVVTKTLCEGCGVCIHECPRGALSWERKEHG